jgi:hypothetical protein
MLILNRETKSHHETLLGWFEDVKASCGADAIATAMRIKRDLSQPHACEAFSRQFRLEILMAGGDGGPAGRRRVEYLRQIQETVHLSLLMLTPVHE